jgi:uncharacterized protein YlxP (DUF503 family)
LQLPDCHSLKEKRQAIKPLMARVRNQFEVSIADAQGATVAQKGNF